MSGKCDGAWRIRNAAPSLFTIYYWHWASYAQLSLISLYLVTRGSADNEQGEFRQRVEAALDHWNCATGRKKCDQVGDEVIEGGFVVCNNCQNRFHNYCVSREVTETKYIHIPLSLVKMSFLQENEEGVFNCGCLIHLESADEDDEEVNSWS